LGPNDADLVRVFTQRVGATIADVTFPVGTDFNVIAEAEAGSALHGAGAQFSTNIVMRDITANNNIPHAPAAGFSGAMASAQWPNLDQRFQYTIASADLAGREDHLCQVITYLTAGVTNPDTSFAESPLFMLTPP
jgi:hypothetical protein